MIDFLSSINTKCVKATVLSGTTVCGVNICTTSSSSSPIVCGGSCVVSPLISGNTICATLQLISPKLQLTNISAKSSETAIAYLTNDGCIVSGTSSGGVTNLGTTYSTTGITITSDTGTDASLTGATASSAGIITTGNQTFAGTKCAPIWCGSTCLRAPIVYASTCVCSPTICGTGCVVGVCTLGRTCVSSPIVCGTTCMRTATLCATIAVCADCVYMKNLYKLVLDSDYDGFSGIQTDFNGSAFSGYGGCTFVLTSAGGSFIFLSGEENCRVDIAYRNSCQKGYSDFEAIGTPSSPTGNTVGRLYVANNGSIPTLYFKDSGGTTTNLSSPVGTTNLSTTYAATTVTINSDTGTDALLTGASATSAGIVTNAAQTFAGAKCSTIWCGTTCMRTATLCATTAACSAIVCATTAVRTPIVCVSTCLLVSTNIVLCNASNSCVLFNDASSTTGRGLFICGNQGASTSAGGVVCIAGGCGGATSGNGALVQIIGGCAVNGTGGEVQIFGGCATTGNGGNVTIQAGCGPSTKGSVSINVWSASPQNSIVANPASCVVLYYNGVTKLCTVTNGICIGANCGFGTDWIATSDCRLKTNIQPISNALSMITQLEGIYYNLCFDCMCEKHVGLIAQDVENIIPEIVSKSKASEVDIEQGIDDEKYGLKYEKLTAVLIEAIKEQQAQIVALEVEVNQLKEKLK